jgi:IgA Peptidase M64
MSTTDGIVQGSTQIYGTASRDRAFNIVLLAEGFTASQQNDFNSACAAFMVAVLETPPFDERKPAINIFQVNVTSTDSGADDPLSSGGKGIPARTYFDATFGGNGIRRLLICNDTTALMVAASEVPEFTVVIVVVNSSIYGGSGGSIGTYSLAEGATEIAIHEMGHTAFRLADEYPYYAGDNEIGHDNHPENEPNEPNVTINNNRNTLKWGWAIAASTMIPTMSNQNCSQIDNRASPVSTGTVGLFEGAHYFHCGAYRPEYDCKMRNLGVPFCKVCRQEILNQIKLPPNAIDPSNLKFVWAWLLTSGGWLVILRAWLHDRGWEPCINCGDLGDIALNILGIGAIVLGTIELINEVRRNR